MSKPLNTDCLCKTVYCLKVPEAAEKNELFLGIMEACVYCSLS